MGRRATGACDAGEELFTCYKASTSSCSESDLEDRLIRWGFPLPKPDAMEGNWTHEHPMQISKAHTRLVLWQLISS